MKIQTRLFVDGQWVEGSSGETIPVINPATGVALAEVQKAAPQDICAAIAAARKAFDGAR
jgi:acyl-CoA reductase-like NAD-dependent aldehyde dehydrogenase